ncbi:unnamed protein product, partial [Coregonus sp. 'balchen']
MGVVPTTAWETRSPWLWEWYPPQPGRQGVHGYGSGTHHSLGDKEPMVMGVVPTTGGTRYWESDSSGDVSVTPGTGSLTVPLKMHCRSCALVTSSGHLMGGGRGEEIDRAECVIRMNDAPTLRGYGRDVGRRTSLRVIAHSSMQRDTVFIFWGPSSYMRRDGKGLVYNNLRLMNQVLPKLKVYIISWQKML